MTLRRCRSATKDKHPSLMNATRLIIVLLTVMGVFSVELGTPDFDKRSSSESLIPKTNTRQHDDSAMSDDDMPQDEFCMDMENMRMVMYMKGFHRSLAHSNKMLPCLSYYVRSWVLNDKSKFEGAMIYSFLLGLLTQGLAVTRAIVFMHVVRPRIRKWLMVLIYVLQVYLGYMIMLVAMMYSVELLLSAVAGLSCGYFLFHKGEKTTIQTRTSSVRRRSGIREPLLSEENRSPTAD